MVFNDMYHSLVNMLIEIPQIPLEVLESLSSNSRLYNIILENYPSLLLCRSSSDKKLNESNGDVGFKRGVTMSMRLQDWSDICMPNFCYLNELSYCHISYHNLLESVTLQPFYYSVALLLT